jgi:hypothetical protein
LAAKKADEDIVLGRLGGSDFRGHHGSVHAVHEFQKPTLKFQIRTTPQFWTS